MSTWPSAPKTALLLAADGTKIYGHGFGATGHTLGEVCFNTAMTGYQEIITDPSYAAQLVAFTFPHIGNVGVNPADIETSNTAKSEAARGIIVRERVRDFGRLVGPDRAGRARALRARSEAMPYHAPAVAARAAPRARALRHPTMPPPSSTP